MSLEVSNPIPVEATLDLVTPPLAMPPGRAIAAKNYEPTERGARRIGGYERYDGRPKPSDQSYWYINVDGVVGTIAAGATVTGATSSATGLAVLAFGLSDTFLVLRSVSGTFQDNENLQVSAATKCVANGTATQRGASTDVLDATYLQTAIEAARDLISAPTGSGPIRGVWKLKGVRYCFRNNAGGSAVDMWKSSTSGWTAVDLGKYLTFTSGGTYEIQEGDAITGATSAATATVRRVILQSGSWAGGDAAGRLVIYGQVGTFQAENIDISGHANSCTIAANSTAQTLPAGGAYRFQTHNFFGSSATVRMYGVNGVGPAFEFDGSYFVSIATGMSTDTPSHLAIHKNTLFLGFTGGSLQNSATGDPLDWDPITGAVEIGLGEEITNLVPEWADTLVVMGRNRLGILYGNDSDDFVFDVVNYNAGAIESTAQLVDTPIYLDDTGIRRLTPSDAVFGNFNIGTLSKLVEPFLRVKRANGVSPTASVIIKRKDQYRLFFDDSTGLAVYFGKRTREKTPYILPFELDVDVVCACSTVCLTGDDADEEVVLFGGDDGFVYEMDVGTSFDGEEVDAYFRPAFYSGGSPSQKKRWHSLELQIDAAPMAAISVSAEFGYGDPDQPPAAGQSFSVAGGGGIWNQDLLNEFYWSAPYAGRATARIAGVGVNVSPAIVSLATYEQPHTISGLVYRFNYRGVARAA